MQSGTVLLCKKRIAYMSQENFWILLSKKIAGEASTEETAELEQLMHQHPEWQFAAQNLTDIWQSHEKTDKSAEEDAYLLHTQRMKEKGVGFDDNILYSYTSQNETSNVSHFQHWKKWYYSATAVAAAVMLFITFTRLNQPTKETLATTASEKNEITTNFGSRTKVQLPDGSTVWLNAGSKIQYDKNFGIKSRTVELTGEAFFDVKKDAEHPFFIHTSNIDIKVIGTAFNVKAYPQDETTEASLIRGMIEVSIKSRPNDKIILSPNEKLIVDNKKSGLVNGDVTTRKPESVVAINEIKLNSRDSTINEIQWVENRLVFDDEPLQSIAVKMERWYNVEIQISDPALAQKHIFGSFINENIDQAMEGLSITGRFHFSRNGNKIIIHP
jgi:transmembrane sensor